MKPTFFYVEKYACPELHKAHFKIPSRTQHWYEWEESVKEYHVEDGDAQVIVDIIKGNAMVA